MSVRGRSPVSVACRSAIAGVLVALLVGATPWAVSVASANPGPDYVVDADDLPSVESLLKRYVEAVGGAEAVRSLRTRVAEMHVVTDLKRDPPIYEVDTLSVHATSEGKFLVITSTRRGTMLEGCDGDREWKIDPNGVVLNDFATGPRDRWMTDPQFPLRMRHYFPVMKVLGVDAWGRDTGGSDLVYVVETDGEESHRLGFDVETGLLTRLGYNVELRDYREADGVLMPMQVAESRKGGSSTFFVDAVEHNVRIDPALFSVAE